MSRNFVMIVRIQTSCWPRQQDRGPPRHAHPGADHDAFRDRQHPGMGSFGHAVTAVFRSSPETCLRSSGSPIVGVPGMPALEPRGPATGKGSGPGTVE
ncbi:hypothetical protein [Methylobacterium sp. ID0610]|uniref:hypothetical protein n=1 Tax=Methylobacterium carpenticola TaxID=3344827 RepID=UPI003689DF5D